MDTKDTIAILILVCIGIVGGYFTARNSSGRETVHSGAIGKAGHYLAAGLLSALAPTVLCTLFFIHPTFLGESVQFPGLGWDVTELAHAVSVAVVLVVVALIALVPYAILEKPELEHLAKRQDTGWTKEDAEASGL